MSSETSYPWFYFYRIARLSFLIFLPTLFVILFIYRTSYKEGLVTQMSLQTEESLQTIHSTLKAAKLDWHEWCAKLPKPKNARYSLVKKDGLIICDTNEERIGKRIQDLSEIHESFSKEYATAVRFSDFFKTEALFASLKISDDFALRKVVPISSLRDDLNRFDRILFFRILPFGFISYLLFLIFFYRATKPLGSILGKVENLKMEIPFNKTLQLLYRQNEWAGIEEALNEADSKLKDQVKLAKAENEKFTAILESIYDDIIAIDKYETVLFYNSNFKRNFKKNRNESELMPKIWHTFSEEPVLEAFRSVLKEGRTVSLKGMNFPIANPNRFFDLTITPLKNAEGQISGALGVFYDVTEFKLTEQMRVDFVANVSHEIRTPLTSIKGYSQVLEAQRSKISPDLHLFLDKIVSNTERMIALFNDLLNLSVIESQNQIKFETFSLPQLFEEVSDNILANYPKKKITIHQEIELDSIVGDHRLIEQVLSNLVDNACKYAGDNLVVKISSYARDNKAYIAVADNGPGISSEHLQRIFERFYRVETSREVSRGTGLGLSIVKHIIAKHGGRIWAESEDSKGTTFVIELPLS